MSKGVGAEWVSDVGSLHGLRACGLLSKVKCQVDQTCLSTLNQKLASRNTMLALAWPRYSAEQGAKRNPVLTNSESLVDPLEEHHLYFVRRCDDPSMPSCHATYVDIGKPPDRCPSKHRGFCEMLLRPKQLQSASSGFDRLTVHHHSRPLAFIRPIINEVGPQIKMAELAQPDQKSLI